MFVQAIGEFFTQRWHEILSVLTGFSIGDALDIIVVALLIYQCIKLVRETRGGQLVKGILFIIVAYVVSGLLEMNVMNWLIEKILDIGFIALIVLFQPELRRMLEHLGRSSKFSLLGRVVTDEEVVRVQTECINELCKACSSMSSSKTGALIVLERDTMLGEVIATGRPIDAAVTAELVCNIFFNKAPLHDGGMIIRFGRILAASCILPLTQNYDLNNELGTRHRAALGLSEISDAVVVVVSEETGTISIALNGKLTRGYDGITLKTELEKLLIPAEDEISKKGIVKKVTGWFK